MQEKEIKLTIKKLLEKQPYKYFRRQTKEIAHKIAKTCLCWATLKRETEFVFTAIQYNTIRRNYVRVRTDRTHKNSR